MSTVNVGGGTRRPHVRVRDAATAGVGTDAVPALARVCSRGTGAPPQAAAAPLESDVTTCHGTDTAAHPAPPRVCVLEPREGSPTTQR